MPKVKEGYYQEKRIDYGIIRDVTLMKCYLPATEKPPLITFNEKQLIKSLYISTLTPLVK